MFKIFLAMSLFLAPSDPQLNEVSLDICPCDIESEEIQSIVKTMYEVAFENTEDPKRAILVGLAAPQIGFQERIILVDVAANGVFTENSLRPESVIKVFISPEILWSSEETNLWREGCFSTHHLCGIVPRANKILVSAYDEEGNFFTEEYEGYTARIIQHEIDHLDGIRFPERVTENGILHWVEEEDAAKYRIEWETWPQVSWDTWLKIKNSP